MLNTVGIFIPAIRLAGLLLILVLKLVIPAVNWTLPTFGINWSIETSASLENCESLVILTSEIAGIIAVKSLSFTDAGITLVSR